MAWNLEICHIDVGQGDSTLVIAREIPPLVGFFARVRSVLIDGGRRTKAADIHNFILTTGIAALDVIIVTHYDADHFNGITTLLTSYAGPLYQNTLIFDQGWPQVMEVSYINYLHAIAGRFYGRLARIFGGVAPNRTRVTKQVLSYGGPLDPVQFAGLNALVGVSVPVGAPGSINQPANVLVGRELMWTDMAGNLNNALHGYVPLPGAVGGAPSIRCIAANTHVLQVGGGNTVALPSGLNAEDQKNARSLAFMIQFENFRYYIGGDISSTQEDNVVGIGTYLAAQGPIHAMKTSHHGSGESTSAAFINLLNPIAAFISCGYNNGFGANLANGAGGPWPMGHPQQRVLADLEANANLQNYYLTIDRSDDDYCRRQKRGHGAWPMAYTQKAVVAGGWGAPNPCIGPTNPSPCGGWWPNDGAPGAIMGNISINVTSGNTPAFTVRYDTPAITQPVLTAPLALPANTRWPNNLALPINTILPTGTIWPGGVNTPLQGMSLNQAHTLAVNLPWPNGQSIMAGAVPPGACDISGFVFPLNTVLPANVVQNGVHLPLGTILPPMTVFPANSSWPAGVPMPWFAIPHGFQLPIGLQLPQGLVFPAGSQWPANTAMPELVLPAGVAWPNGQVLPANTILPTGAQIPIEIQWPAGVALPGAGTIHRVVNH